MIKAIRISLAGMFALITFLFVADRIVWDAQTWECPCTNHECDWCVAIGEPLMSWDEWHDMEVMHAMDVFDAIYDATEFKVSRNGRSMVKGINDKSFKFVKKG